MLDQDHNHMKGILDQYEVVECLGKGCQGTSYKLRRRDNLEYFVLKMIECRSLDHGYLLFEEFIHIQKFIHPYVPRILEIHMSMNPKNSAIYVSVIRSYIDLPSLDFIIKDNIEKSKLEWSLIYRMFGSVLTVITSLKKANCGSIYFHPGNIFLSDKGFFMTDIWGPNLMNYARGVDIYVQSFEYIMNPDLSGELAIECHADELPRRRLPRYIEWCAPETSRFEFTDKSDVWTLGCVITILIYIKCLFKNKEILAVDQLKAKENVFHHLSSAEELETHKELFKLLSQMMKNNPSERISLNDLLDDLYVQVLMKHTNPEFIMRAKRCIVTAAEKPFPVNDTMEAKIKYLHDNWQHENCIEKAVVWFAENILNDKHINLTHRLSPHLFDLMYLHQANLSIITSSLRILAYSIEYEQLQSMSTCSRYPYEDVSNQSSSLLLLSSSSSYRLFKESNYFKNICKINNLYLVLVIMKKHLQYVNVQRLGLEFFKSLININYSTSINLDVIKDYLQTYNTIFKKLHTINLCHHLIELLNCTTNKEMIKIGISYLWKFCIYEPIALQAADKNTLSITTQLMESNQFDCEIFTNGSMVIVSLLRINIVKRQITNYNKLIYILLHGLIQFKNLPITIWNICLCLQVVISLSEYFALQFTDEVEEDELKKEKKNGFDILYLIYNIHPDNTKVIEALLKPITSLMKYDNNSTTSEGKRIVAAKIAGAVSSGGSPARVINAFIQVKDYQGLDKYLSKHKVPTDILTASLQSACMRSDSEAVGTFAKHGGNVNHTDQFGTTLLHFAMRGGGDENVIKALVAHGLEYHSWRSAGMPLLHWSCSTGLINLVEYLVEHGTASLQEADENGRLPIHVAAVFGQPVILSYLIRVLSTRLHPLNIPAQFLPALNEDNECSLEEEEAEDDVNNKQNQNPFHCKLSVTAKDSSEGFKANVMKTVAAANYLDMNHWTPLHHASCEDAVNHYYDCIKILLDNGADPMLPTSQGKTALDLAYAAGRSQMLVDVLPKKQLIALLMLIDDIVPLKVRKRLSEEEKLKERTGLGGMTACEPYAVMSAKREPSPGLSADMHKRSRKGYSFIRRLADKMDTTDVSKGQLGNFTKTVKVDSTNIMSIWRKILLNDNVELLETLRDSMAWRQSKSNTSTLPMDFSKISDSITMPTDHISLDDFETAQQISLKQMSELFSDCYENGTGVFTHVQGAFQENLKAHDFRTVLQSMSGLLTFKSLSTNKIVILRPMHRSLLFLAIICGRFRVVEQLIRMRQFDVLPAAVLVTLILRRLHKEPTFPQQMLGELITFADRLEAIAVDVLNLVFLKDNTPEKMICRSMLNAPLRTFGGISLIDLCAKAKCTNVLSLSCCQRLLDERWHGVLICLPIWMRWTCKFFPVAGLFYFEYRTKKELKRAELIRSITASAASGGKVTPNLLSDSTSRTDVKSSGHIITKVFPATPQLTNNPLVTKRTKTTKVQNTISVHSSQGPKPHVGIYERMSNQFGWTSSPRLHFVTGVYLSPSMKFCLHSLFHLLFLMLFSVVCVYNLHFSCSRMEIVSLSYVLGYAFEELRQLILEASRDGFSDYLRDGWNWIDVFAITLTSIGFCTRMNVVNKHGSEFEEAHDVILYTTRNLYMLGLNLFYMRTLHITSISPIIGPRLKMMADMLRKDLIPLLIVFAIFIISYGVWFQGLIYPNSFYETHGQRQKKHLMNITELSRQRDMQRLGVLMSFSELFRRAFYSIFEVSIVLEEETCEDNKYCGSELGFNTVIFFVLVLYVGIVNIILINLLIALFSNTVSRIDQKSTAHWLAGRYKMVKEYSERTLLPPPFNTLCIIYELFRCFYIGTSQCFCKNIKFPFGRNKKLFKTESNDDLEEQENESPDEENSNLKKHLTRENQLIKIKEENNRRIKLLMGESDDRGKLYKQEIDAVLKFILIQSFALQNSRQTLGTGVSFRGPYTSQNASSSDGTTTSESIQLRNNQIDSRLERIEAILEKVVDRVNQIKITDTLSSQATPTIRSPVPIRMPSVKLTHAPTDVQFIPTKIPTSKELFQQLNEESQSETETNAHSLTSKLPSIKIQKSS